MKLESPYREITAVLAALRAVGADGFVGGSVASSIHGVPRATRDADLVVNLSARTVSAFVRALGDGFLADEETIRTALGSGRSWNVIDVESAFKVDCFPAGDRRFDELEWDRTVDVEVAPGIRCRMASPEDVVLRKLAWFRLGGEVSDRQWQDVIGVLRMRSKAIDLAYLRKWAPDLGVADLVDRVLGEA